MLNTARQKVAEQVDHAQAESSFIEVQFPISKLSKESYKERKAGSGQTLTGLGKWWGRKPLILVRATIIGALMPASKDQKKDKEIFLKILTMDEEGLFRRKQKPLPPKTIYQNLSREDRNKYFSATSTEKGPKFLSDLNRESKQFAEGLAWKQLSYDEKLTYCCRPEEIEGPSKAAWKQINEHLGTHAHSIVELVQELGKRRFGHIPRVGDAFCGGGSVPFEAARIGCEAYGADLNPVAVLLTWAALNVLGADKEKKQEIERAQKQLFKKLDDQFTKWGLEHNEQGWRADVFLYCNEATCPECAWEVPLAPTWIISDKNKVCARLVINKKNKMFDIHIESGASEKQMKEAEIGTIKDNALHCPNCKNETSIRSLRGDRVIKKERAEGKQSRSTQYGLRLWDNDDLVPRKDDVFRERLYCIRWQKPTSKGGTERVYVAPTEGDFNREAKALSLLKERFKDWQGKGIIPSMKIEPGDKTDEPIRTRGWTHWHHLFNPRQLLMLGLLNEEIGREKRSDVKGALTLVLGNVLNWVSRLAMWNIGRDTTQQVFSNQALNTLYNFPSRGTAALHSLALPLEGQIPISSLFSIETMDARNGHAVQDIWITDPPYADAVNYHELSEYFLAWYAGRLKDINPKWYVDTRRALAIRGRESDFNSSMVASYKNLNDKTSELGLHLVMFTHQDAKVWANLALILWSAGLRVTSAWCISTETEAGLKKGNYVKGTVCLNLRKRTTERTAFLDDLYPEIEDEVKDQLDSMRDLENKDDPDFGDADYQLAAYAAALRVLTKYKQIEDLDAAHELSSGNGSGQKSSAIVKIIESAVKIASEYLIPVGLDVDTWRKLTPIERFYLKGLDVETRGEYRNAVYQELARGFGVKEYKSLIASSRANQFQLRTPSEFGRKELGGEEFGGTITRQVLFAIFESIRSDGVQHGKNWLKNEVEGYWEQRKMIMSILEYLGVIANKIPNWEKEADVTRLLWGAVKNDHV